MTVNNSVEVCFHVHHQVMIYIGGLESMKEEKELFKTQWGICLQSAAKLLTRSPFQPPSSSLWSFLPSWLVLSTPLPQKMLCGNCCDLELQASNIEWGSGVFSTVYCMIKRVLFGALKVLLKDNLSTNYVADCSFWSALQTSQGHHNSMMNSWKHESVIILHLLIMCRL